MDNAASVQNDQISPKSSNGHAALLFWVTLRLPLLLALLYVFREALVSIIEAVVGVVWPTGVTVNLLSTIAERAVLFLVVLVLLAVGFGFIRAAVRSERPASLARLGFGFTVFLGLFSLSAGFLAPLDIPAALALAALLAYNTQPSRAFGGRQGKDVANSIRAVVYSAAVGVEALLPRPFLSWLASRLGEEHVAVKQARRWIPSWAPGVLTTSAIAVLFLTSTSWEIWSPVYPAGLLKLRRTWYPDPSVEMLGEEDVHWLELSADRSTLFASGYGTPHLMAYNVRPPFAPRRTTPVDTERAENFGYDPKTNALYVFKTRTDELLVLDASTLSPRSSFSVPPLAPGEVTVVPDADSGQIFLLSEADIESGPTFAALELATGRVRTRMDLDAGSGGIMDPSRSVLYLAFFRRRAELVAYDTEQNRIRKAVATEPRIDGIVFDERSDQVLIGSPLNSTVLRYDAETLERRADLPASFGVRGLALDPVRNLVFSASIATNRLTVIDLASESIVAQYTVGPWLRRVKLDTENGIAYVSSRYGLYRVNYTERLPSE